MTKTFSAPDGTQLAYRTVGQADDGPPLVCVPGGPMRDSVYFGDLGGLAARQWLVTLDLRGTGASDVPADPETYRCDRQVDDIEALRKELGLERLDLLAHSAAGDLAVLYAARYPQRVRSLVLVATPSRALGVEISDEQRRTAAQLRSGEPWFEDAYAALLRVAAGQGDDADWAAIAPFLHGRWDDAAREMDAGNATQRNAEAAQRFAVPAAFDPPATRAAIATLTAPVLMLAGELDLNPPADVAAEIAAAFPEGRLALVPGGGHNPWLDDPDAFVAAITGFLATAGS